MLKHHEELKNVAQALAFVGAGLFFAFKLAQGFMITDNVVTVTSERASAGGGGQDFLAVEVKLTRGVNGSLEINEMWANIRPLQGTAKPMLVPFQGIERVRAPVSETGNWRVDTGNSKINLPPGEATQFAAGATVDSDEAYVIEVMIDGQRRISPWRAQWKASTISLPHAKRE